VTPILQDTRAQLFGNSAFCIITHAHTHTHTHTSILQVGTLEAIKVKILIMGEEQNPLTLRIELTSENDLFFHFNHNLDEHGFRQVSNSACPICWCIYAHTHSQQCQVSPPPSCIHTYTCTQSHAHTRS